MTPSPCSLRFSSGLNDRRVSRHAARKTRSAGNLGRGNYNEKLSDRRAASVRKYLVAHGVDAGRLTSKGYGMKVPIVPNTSDQNRALNRRVQFVRTEGNP